MMNQIRPYEPLTSENAALILVDHQVGLMTRRPRLFDRRAQAQRGGPGQSGEGAETADRRHHDCA